jgi:23S rRNA A1618 N6-methylase RlmF
MQAEQGQGQENVCSLCPTTDMARANLPEPPILLEAPMAFLRCGHQVHTHCLINELYTRMEEVTCAECQITILSERALSFIRDRHEEYRNVSRRTVATLWADNEEFRNDAKEYKKLCGTLTKAQRIYTKELGVIKRRFKQNVLTSIELINDQKKQSTIDLNALESRKLYKKAGFAIRRKLNHFRSKWDISPRTLRELNDIEGAPKIYYKNMYYRWRCSPKYIFRLKL